VHGVSGRVAVVLFNLGGPDKPEAIRPFLFNLFNDPAIINLPGPLRTPLAAFIAWRRAPVAKEIYGHIGGSSPLLALTEQQAAALEKALSRAEGAGTGETKVFIAMRYWQPMADETALAVKDFNPGRVILLPLYPQYSTTTSASSISDWRRAAAAANLDAPTDTVCCYPAEPGLIRAHVERIRPAIREAAERGAPRILFSAHGLPKKIIAAGDPYAWQVEQTARAVVAELDIPDLAPQRDWVICYQSRVGPLEWIGPSLDDELKRAAVDRRPVVVAPIAFVSEHSETLVELDIEYRKLAQQLGLPAYVRVPAVGASRAFIDGLAGLVRRAIQPENESAKACPANLSGCPRPCSGGGP